MELRVVRRAVVATALGVAVFAPPMPAKALSLVTACLDESQVVLAGRKATSTLAPLACQTGPVTCPASGGACTYVLRVSIGGFGTLEATGTNQCHTSHLTPDIDGPVAVGNCTASSSVTIPPGSTLSPSNICTATPLTTAVFAFIRCEVLQ